MDWGLVGWIIALIEPVIFFFLLGIRDTDHRTLKAALHKDDPKRPFKFPWEKRKRKAKAARKVIPLSDAAKG